MTSVRIHLAVVLISASVMAGSASAQEKLVLTTMTPPNTLNDFYFKPWGERVSAASNGAVAVELRYGVTLANFGNIYQRVQDDVVQIGWQLLGLAGGQFELSDVAALPFVVLNGEEAGTALHRLYKSGIVDAEYREIVPLQFGVFPQLVVHYGKEPRTLDSLNGLKMGVNSRSMAATVQRLGATPISIQTHELYESTQRGVIDGFLIGWGAFPTYKLGEVTTYHVEVPLGSSTTALFMAKKKFEALTAAGRKAIEDNSGEAASRAWSKFFDDAPTNPGGGQHKVAQLTAAQQAQWQRMVEPYLEEWGATRPNGTQVLTRYKALVAEFRTQNKK